MKDIEGEIQELKNNVAYIADTLELMLPKSNHHGAEMDPDDIKSILHKPLLEKLKIMQESLQCNIDVIYKQSEADTEECNMTEYARANGQIWGLQYAKGMLDAILRLEEGRDLWDKEKKSDTKESARTSRIQIAN